MLFCKTYNETNVISRYVPTQGRHPIVRHGMKLSHLKQAGSQLGLFPSKHVLPLLPTV